ERVEKGGLRNRHDRLLVRSVAASEHAHGDGAFGPVPRRGRESAGVGDGRVADRRDDVSGGDVRLGRTAPRKHARDDDPLHVGGERELPPNGPRDRLDLDSERVENGRGRLFLRGGRRGGGGGGAAPGAGRGGRRGGGYAG